MNTDASNDKTRERVEAMRTDMTKERVLRAAATLTFSGVFAGLVLGRSAPIVAAAPCAGAAATATSSTPATPASLPTMAIPTEAAIAPEVNPPGDIPDNQAFVTYTSTEGGYSVAMPEGWARRESGPNVSFVDKLHRFTVEITCAAAAPTEESAKTTDAAFLAKHEPAFALVEVTSIDLPAGPAILIRYQANSAPDEVTGKQTRLDVDCYELFQNGQMAAISLAGPAGSDNVDVSNQVSRSFRWTT
jgi:hypothetical protein